MDKNNKIKLQKKNILIIDSKNDIKESQLKYIKKNKISIILISKNIKNLKKYKKIVKNISLYPINTKYLDQNELKALHHIIKIKYKNLNGIIFNTTEIEKLKPFDQFSINEWNKIIKNNFINILIVIKELIIMLKKNSSITFILYKQKKISKAYFGAHACANSSLISLMNIINDEYSSIKNIRINGISLENINIEYKNNTHTYENKTKTINIDKIIKICLFLIKGKYYKIKNKIFSSKNITISK
ncbi:MAG TPA: SDR family NAD(P)-dependent oxidoreductase [Candidatus Azoamicus sp. OHIO1]